MLPFDNKNELQLVIDGAEGTTLERTDAALRDFEDYLRTVNEVVAFESYAGLASPMDFNGLVRHYYLRRGPHQGELRLILADKKLRTQQSHAIALRLRDPLTEIAQRHQVRLKIVESPPGPPVISTITAEVYGRPDQGSDELRRGAQLVAERLRRESGVVDVDSTVEAPQARHTFVVDRAKAAVNGVSDADLVQTLSVALGGSAVSTAQAPTDRNELNIVLRLPEVDRSSLEDLNRLYVRTSAGQMVPLAELGSWRQAIVEQTIYHKNLRPVQYVFAEVAGRAPAEAIVDVEADRQPAGAASGSATPRAVAKRTYIKNGAALPWSLLDGLSVTFSGEGEWQITLDVFRDLGLAFAAALVAIYILLVHETGSFLLPVVIMLAIPLTILGIMPGFWLLNQFGIRTVGGYPDPVFFTATAMIGMIALAGIVTRDAIILVDFIHHSLARGRSLFDAIMESRVVRLRPILLTAGAAMLGAWPITLDPIFSGLAWALIFGLLASTVFTLFVIPVSYWLLYHNKPGHGLPAGMLQQHADQAQEAASASPPRDMVTVSG
jgi:multidrug efflux pump subunit AcrB